MPVLVTGGAGYIGSHAVLALLDAGWPVVVIDDLSTGFDWAVPEGAVFVEGDIDDQRPARADHRRAADRRDHAFRRLGGGARIGREPAQILSQQHGEEPRADRERGRRRGVALHLLLDRGDLRHSRRRCRSREDAPTEPINPYGWSKLMTERMLTDTAAAHPINYCALRYFNVAGADPEGRVGPVDRRAPPT